MTRVFGAPEPKGADRLMLLALADNANDEGLCWPSVPTLARKCAVRERSAQRTIRRLEEDGFIQTDARRGRSSVYRLVGARLTPDVGDTPDAGDTPGKGDTITPDTRVTAPPTPAPPEPSGNRQEKHQQRAREGAGEAMVSGAAAATVKKEGGPKELVQALVARGVDEPVARTLVLHGEAGHIRAMLRRGETEAAGPGWYVMAVRNGYVAKRGGPGQGGRLLSYQEALRQFERLGGRFDAHFEPVQQEGGKTLFRRRCA